MQPVFNRAHGQEVSKKFWKVGEKLYTIHKLLELRSSVKMGEGSKLGHRGRFGKRS